ncbi:MAG: hypothetical protein WCP09_02510 [Candidatus Taylorbacteria bacterium]
MTDMSVKNNLSLAPISNATVPQFMSRVFSDRNGRLYRFTFLVSFVNGEMKGQLVSAEPVSTSHSASSEASPYSNGQIFMLPVCFPVKKPETAYVFSFAPVVSPYFSVDFLINCQPTRAPASK